jgi:tRNA modification GTPase
VTSGDPADTIVAAATPLARSALAIVRIDGPLAHSIISSLTGREPPAERLATRVTLREEGEALDDCVITVYRGPRSYTGNDLVEISLHGGAVIAEDVIRAVVRSGARPAEPGEFTERAVLNGKIDLIQAEAIADLIDARTSLQARMSLANVEGRLSLEAAGIREKLLFVISRLEAALDFSEEGYDFITRTEATAALERVIAIEHSLIESYERGRATRQGLTIVLLGAPNSGKSTLLNALVGSERAIVTEIAGTTRDLISETIAIGGLPVTITDTAGLRASSDVVETIGIERARKAAAGADLVLYLIDSTVGRTSTDDGELILLPEAVIIHTKADLMEDGGPAFSPQISALSGRGMPGLFSLLDGLVRDRFAVHRDAPAVVNERQVAALRDGIDAVRMAKDTLETGASEEIVLTDLYRGAAAIERLVGGIVPDDIYAEIFAKFCIGK